MKVILKDNIDRLGKLGDDVEVTDGYARNYLIPRGLVWPYEEKYLKRVENLKNRIKAEKIRQKTEADEKAKKIEETSITIEVEVGEDDKLFGSVTNIDITDKLKEAGIEVDKKNIRIQEPIKKLGVYKVMIKMHPEVETTCKVWVVKK